MFLVKKVLYYQCSNNEDIITPTSFNYIGSKIKLLDFIGDTIQGYIGKPLGGINSFMDCFSGTGVVSYYMIQKGVKNIISNDLQYYSSVISSVWTSNNISISNLRAIINNLNKNIEQLEEHSIEATEKDFVYNNYSPAGNRMYFSSLNAYKIDKLRQEIEVLHSRKEINEIEYKCLLKILLYAVSNVANIASVYGAFLKKFKPSALKKIQLDVNILSWFIEGNCVNHITYNHDIIQLLDDVKTEGIECSYLDSPYNNRPYHTNYHILESISRYDYPELKGKTGLRRKEINESKLFTSKATVGKAFFESLTKLKSRYVFISYSSEAILGKDEIISILTNTGWVNVSCVEKLYPRFKSDKKEDKKEIVEYIFCATNSNK